MEDSFEAEFLKKYCKKQRPKGCSNCHLFNQCFCRGCDGGFEYWDCTSLYNAYKIAVMAIEAEHVEKNERGNYLKDYEKINCLQAYCDKQVTCNKCSLRNIDGSDGCTGLIEDWEDEKVDKAYKMIFKEEKALKEFLTDRRVVEFRNGERYLVVGNFLMGKNDYFIKGDFTDDLTNRGLRKFDVVRIYEDICKIETLYNKDLDVIWERKPKKMTKEEIEEALGYEIEIVEKEINK